MKKFFPKFMGYIVNYAMLITLACSVMAGYVELERIPVAYYWIVMIVWLFTSILILLLVHAMDHAKDDEARQRIANAVAGFMVKERPMMRAFKWVVLVVIFSLLALSGWVVTGVAFVITSLICKFLLSMARGKVHGEEEGLFFE